MRRLIALPMLVTVLTAQAPAEIVVSVGHSGSPDRAAFVGSYVASASWSNVAIIDLSSGLAVAHLPQGALVEALEGSPAGDLLAVGTCGHAIQLWSVKSRNLVRRFTVSDECAHSLAFSPDGAFLASAADGVGPRKGVQVWDVRTGDLSRELAGPSVIRHVVFSGDGRWLAAVDDAGKARVFEWPSGRELRTFEGLAMPGDSGSVAFASRDGRYFAWLGNGLRLFDVAAGSEVSLPGVRQVAMTDKSPAGAERQWTEQQVVATAAEFLDDGRLAYVDGDRMVLLKVPDGPQQLLPLAKAETQFAGDVGITKPQSWLKIRRDGRLLAGTRESRTVVWDVARAALRELIAPALMSASTLQWGRSGLIAWADLESGPQGWDDRSGKPANLGKRDTSAGAVAFGPDGRWLAVSGYSSMYVLDVASGRKRASLDRPPGVETGVAVSSDGSHLAFASSSEIFGLFDSNLRLQRRLESLEDYTRVEHVAFSADGLWIAAALGGAHPSLRVWPALGSDSAITLATEALTYGPQPPAFSSDSRRLASFVRGTSLTIWSTSSWNVERTWTLPGTGRALAFAPEGSRLAVASDGEAAIWDADTGGKLVTFGTPGSAQMTEIAWSPNGRRVVTSADDGVLRFWSSSDGQLLASLYMLDSDGDWLLVTPDGRLDGSDRALSRFVAWRVGERVTLDRALTQRHRVRGLWRSLR
jgi:WD40 repeat protein